MGIHKTIGGAETAAYDVVRTQFRGQVDHVVRLHQLDLFQAGLHLPPIVVAQVLHVALPGGDEQVSLGTVAGRVPHHLIERAEKWDGVERHLNAGDGGELRAHTAHALARGAFALMAFPFDYQHAAAACFGQVISHAGSDDAAADYDYVRRFQKALLWRWVRRRFFDSRWPSGRRPNLRRLPQHGREYGCKYAHGIPPRVS